MRASEPLLKKSGGVLCMGIKHQGRKVMNFHSVKSLGDIMLLQVVRSVKGFMSEVWQLTSASSVPSKASFFCVCRKLHITQKNATLAVHRCWR